MKKVNATDSEYSPVPQGLQSDDDELKSNLNGDSEGLKNGSLKKIEETNLEKGKLAPSTDEVVPMTPLRKFCFVLSILQCGLFIVAFGYLIPCQIPRYYDNSVETWNIQLKENDIITNIALAQIDQKQSVLVFGIQSTTNNTYGVRAVDALTGAVKWTVDFKLKPVSVICNAQFKTGEESQSYCLVTNDLGKMSSLPLNTGEPEWFMHWHEGELNLQTISTPVILDDCHGDGINEVVVSGVTSEGLHTLYVVSGYDGKTTNNITLSPCGSAPQLLAWEDNKEWKIVLNCVDKSGVENVWAIGKNQLCINNSNADLQHLDDALVIHSLEKGDSLARAIIVRNMEANNHLVMVSEKGSVIISGSTPEDYWSVDLPVGSTFKDITGGAFINSTDQSVAILYQEDGASMITILDLETREQLNITYHEPRATFLYTAINGIEEPDTILIRNRQGEVIENAPEGTTPPVEELIALDCKDGNGTFVTVWSAPSVVKCSGDNCRDVVSNRTAVVIGDFNSSGKQLAIVVYHISVTQENSNSTVGTQIELLRLYNSLPTKCKTCGCR